MPRFDTKDGNPGRYSASGAAVLNDGDSSAHRVDNTGALVISGSVGSGGEYNATPPTLADQGTDMLQFDNRANLKVTLATLIGGEDLTNNVMGVAIKPVASATYSPTAGATFGTSVAIAAKTSAGSIKSFYVLNTNAAARYLQIHNKASAPASTEVPVFSFYIPPTTGVVEIGTEFFGENGLFLSTGIAIGVSTTQGTFTAATAADHVVNYTFI